MKTWTTYIREHLLSQFEPLDPLPRPIASELVLERQTLVERFETRRAAMLEGNFPQAVIGRFANLRTNRLAFGFYRYHHNFRSGERGSYNYISRATECLITYLADGNQEWLVDAANYCMIEFVQYTCHEHPFFSAADVEYYGMPKSVVSRAVDCLLDYRQSANQKWLMFAANFCFIEFAQPSCHPHPHFTPEDDGEHAQRV